MPDINSIPNLNYSTMDVDPAEPATHQTSDVATHEEFSPQENHQVPEVMSDNDAAEQIPNPSTGEQTDLNEGTGRMGRSLEPSDITITASTLRDMLADIYQQLTKLLYAQLRAEEKEHCVILCPGPGWTRRFDEVCGKLESGQDVEASDL